MKGKDQNEKGSQNEKKIVKGDRNERKTGSKWKEKTEMKGEYRDKRRKKKTGTKGKDQNERSKDQNENRG
jgi:hypothetical protein